MVQVSLQKGAIEAAKDKVIVVNLFEGVAKPGGATGAVDKALGGMISEIISSGDFKGEWGQTYLFRTFGKIPAERVLLLGLGKQKEFTKDRIREAAAKSSNVLKKAKITAYSTIVHGAGIGGFDAQTAGEAFFEGLYLGAYSFDRYKTEKKEENGVPVEKVTVLERDGNKVRILEKSWARAKILAEATNLCRDLVNLPAQEATPTYLASVAQRIAKENKLKITVYSREEMQKLGMGGVLGVAQGSAEPPKFIVLEYGGGRKGEKPICLVGKGITFDSGGLSLKPWDFMVDMKEDMSGAAAVICSIQALARLKVKANVIGIAPCTENLPSARPLKPGDILKTFGGKTIEVLNTDAEGRLVLSDGLGYACSRDPQAIVDIATLTGACMVALGRKATGVMGTDQKLIRKILKASGQTGDQVWQLPLYDELSEQVKSNVADVKNVGGRYGGAITAALLLKKMVGDFPWAHLDIAGPAFTDLAPDGIKKEYQPVGATGVGVRLFVNLVENWNTKG